MPKVFVPALLRDLSGGAEEIDVEGGTVREVIDSLDWRFPGVRARLCVSNENGALGLRPGLTVAVNGAVNSMGLRAKTSADSEVHFLPGIAGG